MRIFTLGKKGIPLFFFALILLSGTLPSYGQENCPTEANTPSNQDFCYLQTVSDIETDGNAVYRTETAANPIPSNELLQDGTTYYVGSQTGGCARIAVAVSVTQEDAPVSRFGQFFTPCVYGVDDTDASTVQDLLANFDGAFTLEVYTSQTGGTQITDLTTPLVGGTSYFVGQFNEQSGCRSARVAVSYDPLMALAPEGEAAQVFCAGATIADLVASGTNNWYSTATSFPALDPSTPLINGETYFGTLVLNRNNTNLPPCESQDRLAVTVEVQEGFAGADNSETSCLSAMAARLEAGETPRELFLSLLDQGVATDGTFEPTIEELAAQVSQNPIGTFQTTYTVTTAEGCEDSTVLTYVVEEDPNAGPDVTITFCTAEFAGMTQQQAIAYVIGQIQLDPNDYQQDGFDQAEFLALMQNFDFQNPVGNYPLTYTVGEGACEDTAILTLSIVQSPNAGADKSSVVCNAILKEEVKRLPEDVIEGFLAMLDEGVPTNGTFEPSIEEIITSYQANNIQTFTTVYTVSNGECTDSTTLSMTVTEDTPANAGSDVSLTFCTAQGEQDLMQYLSGDADPNGSFVGLEGNIFDPMAAGAGTHTVNYVVDSTVECVTGEDTAVYTIEVTGGMITEEPVVSVFCNTEVPGLFPNANALRTYIFQNLQSLGIEIPQTGTFTPSLQSLINQYVNVSNFGEFTTNYTFTNNNCESSIELTMIINEPSAANAGSDTELSFCTTEGDQDLTQFLSEDAATNGRFEGLDGNIFDPMTAGVGTHTVNYVVDSSTGCVTGEDSAVYTIEVFEGIVPGTEITTELCNSDVTDIIPNIAALEAYVFGNLPADVPQDGTFTPSLQSLVEQYEKVSNFGEFTTTYTVANENCESSFVLTLIILDPATANAGEDEELSFCSTEGVQNLYEFLAEGVPATGVFEGLENGMFDPATAELGVTTVTYTLDQSANACATEDSSATFTITVSDPEQVSAGEDTTVEFCVNQGSQNLLDALAEGVDASGTFEGLENNTFNPADYEVGSYDFTYTVVANEACEEGQDSAVITVTVTAAPAAPTAAAQSFCAVDGTTVADLTAEGDNLTWYTDEALTTPANDADAVVAGTYYVTNTTEGGCESAATAVVVTLTDSAAPTLTTGGNVFCEFDNPTIADLAANVTGGTLTWYDAATGGTALNSSQALQNGTTYYAASTDATSACESSVRLAVTVTLEVCEIIIPEAFSPNGDGINDRFEIANIASEYPNYNIEIYNRWGNIVFKGNASTPDWDGVSTESRSLGDKVLPVGVYFYIVNYNDGQTAPTQGRLYLSR